MLTLSDGRKELYQWDTGRKLIVDGECSEVHYSNKILGDSVDIPVVDGVAEIPDELLQTNRDLNVWAYVGNAESGYTKEFKVFRVERRPKPSDYVYTPSEIKSLKELAERVKVLEETGGVTDEQIKDVVEDYLKKNPPEAGGGTTDYEKLLNLPSINGVELKGGLSPEDLGLQEAGDYATETFVTDKIAEAQLGGGSDGTGGLTAEQKKTLWDLIKIATFTENPAAAINAFKSAWNIEEENTPDIPDVPDTPDEPENPDIVNLFDKNTMIIENKYINANGVISPDSTAKLARIPIEPNMVYALQIGGTYDGNIGGNLGTIAMFDSSDILICEASGAGVGAFRSPDNTPYGDLLSDTSGKGYTFTTVENAAYLYFTAKLSDSKNFVDTIMLETGNTCHDYVNYVGGAE